MKDQRIYLLDILERIDRILSYTVSGKSEIDCKSGR